MKYDLGLLFALCCIWNTEAIACARDGDAVADTVAEQTVTYQAGESADTTIQTMDVAGTLITCR